MSLHSWHIVSHTGVHRRMTSPRRHWLPIHRNLHMNHDASLHDWRDEPLGEQCWKTCRLSELEWSVISSKLRLCRTCNRREAFLGANTVDGRSALAEGWNWDRVRNLRGITILVSARRLICPIKLGLEQLGETKRYSAHERIGVSAHFVRRPRSTFPAAYVASGALRSRFYKKHCSIGFFGKTRSKYAAGRACNMSWSITTPKTATHRPRR